MRTIFAIGCAALSWGCQGPLAVQTEDVKPIAPSENWQRDIVATDSAIDVTTRRASATISLASGTADSASFEVGDLEIESVTSAGGAVPFRIVGTRLDVGVPAKKPSDITIHYVFRDRDKLEGSHQTGVTFTWPNFCGNLFPCKSDPSDGVRFGLEITGVPGGQLAVFPETIDTDAPSYMLAWAVGAYTKESLGATAAGTRASVWYLPGEKAAALSGTQHLVAVFDWYERTYGAYPFGDEVGSVSAPWGQGAFGGMEHHPFWHVSSGSMADEETHAHEAAHGWFGDGVRLRCWEDLTLSEGTVSYITARAIEAVAGENAGAAVWTKYQSRLANVVASADRKAWPDGCNQVDVLNDLWNDVVYMKGAFFYRAVEAEVGRAALDGALARFYAERRGQASGMSDMLETIREETGFDATPLAASWLRQLGTPAAR